MLPAKRPAKGMIIVVSPTILAENSPSHGRVVSVSRGDVEETKIPAYNDKGAVRPYATYAINLTADLMSKRFAF